MYKRIATALYDAFQEEPFYLAIAHARANKKESVQTTLVNYFHFSIQEAQNYGIFYQLKDTSIGASLWLKPLSKELSEQKYKKKRDFILNQLGEDSWMKYKEMADLMGEKEQGVIKSTYWYLSILAVAKKHQGAGYGTQLMHPILSELDSLGAGTYLETFTKGNLFFYQKLGYKVVVKYMEPLLKKTCWVLARPAQNP